MNGVRFVKEILSPVNESPPGFSFCMIFFENIFKKKPHYFSS